MLVLFHGGWGFPDLIPAVQAIVLFVPLLTLPGYVAAWLSNLFGFRAGSLLRRIAVAIPLSLSVAPILIQLLWRYGSISAVWRFYEAVGAIFIGTIAADCIRRFRASRREVFRSTPLWMVGTLAAVVWTILALGSLLDLRIDGRRYYSVTAHDYRARIAMTSSIAQQVKLPPESPFLNPGHGTPMRYHYFWSMVCALVTDFGKALNWSVAARDAVAAGTVWAGIALLCAIALYLRFFCGLAAADWKSYLLGFGLLGVTGLDIIPVVAHDAFFRWHTVYATVEWWNEPVTAWLDGMLWAPHYVVGLVCWAMAFLMLWKATDPSSKQGWTAAILLAGTALASACGASIYVFFVAGLCLAGWGLYLAKTKDYSAFLAIAAAGAAGLVLATPFLREMLVGPATGAPGHGPGRMAALPFAPTVRMFGPLNGWTPPAWGRHWLMPLARLLLLPLNYFLELGFFFAVAVIQWRRFKMWGMSRADRATVVMLGISVLACTFLRSQQLGSNDLGWRGFMIAQFILLLWAVGILWKPEGLTPRQKRVLGVLMLIGIASSAYDILILRAFMPIEDAWAGRVESPDNYLPNSDGRLGARIFALAEGYDWVQQHTAATDLIQLNPKDKSYEYGLYADRRGAVLPDCEGFAPDREQCVALRRVVLPAFSRPAPADGLAEVCHAAPIRLVIVEDTDPVWLDPESWIWKTPPAHSSQFQRIFRCEQ